MTEIPLIKGLIYHPGTIPAFIQDFKSGNPDCETVQTQTKPR